MIALVRVDVNDDFCIHEPRQPLTRRRLDLLGLGLELVRERVRDRVAGHHEAYINI